MIDKKDLRIGNLLYEGFIFAIEEETALISVDGKIASNRMPYSIVNPIIITPQFLQLCGFKYTPCGISGADMWQGLPYWSCGYFTLRGRVTTTKGGHLNLAGYYNTEIQYFHQLQNLYYVLTKKELNVEEVYKINILYDRHKGE
jgi:hypothetical protein